MSSKPERRMPNWSDELEKARANWHRMYLEPASMYWLQQEKTRPTTASSGAWQRILFAGAAGGRPELVQEALANGASATAPLFYAWPAVEDGQLVEIKYRVAAFHWCWAPSPTNPKHGMAVYSPLQAAVAGASKECILLVSVAGGCLESMVAWIANRKLNVPRLEAGLALFQTLDPHAYAFRTVARDWLRYALPYLNGMALEGMDSDSRQRVLTLHRGFSRAFDRYGLPFSCGSGVTAELL